LFKYFSYYFQFYFLGNRQNPFWILSGGLPVGLLIAFLHDLGRPADLAKLLRNLAGDLFFSFIG